MKNLDERKKKKTLKNSFYTYELNINDRITFLDDFVDTNSHNFAASLHKKKLISKNRCLHNYKSECHQKYSCYKKHE